MEITRQNNFINEEEIFNAISEGEKTSREEVLEIINKAKECRGISLKEAAVLLQVSDHELLNELYSVAGYIKEKIYGKRIVFFAPMYVSNVCANNCLYCAFRKDNTELERIVLSPEEIKKDTEVLLKQGHKRVLAVAGEHPKYSGIEYLEKVVNAIYSAEWNGMKIRRVNVNCAPLNVEDFKRLKETNIGTYQIFQETYHYDTYKKMHPSGPKKDMNWRLSAFDRAIEGGIEDLGLGALFGLYDYRFEVLAILQHSHYLDSKFRIGPHTISIPRLEPALNAPAANQIPYAINDDMMRKIVSVLRVAVPYTGIILSTRERAEFRNELISLGVSQVSAGSRVGPGEYSKKEGTVKTKDQFLIADERSLSEMIDMLMNGDYIPSFCTACYRKGRTGEVFMDIAKQGDIHNMCNPNALISFREYLHDFANEEEQKKGNKLIEKHLSKLEPKTQKITKEMIEKIDKGEKDQYL